MPKNATKKVSKKRDFIVLVLLPSHVERVGVSRLGDFLDKKSTLTFLVPST